MTDDIKTSIALTKWLDAQKITIEVDEFAPVVMQCPECKRTAISIPRGNPLFPGIACHNQSHRQPCYYVIVCPYFGPGGSDNSLKALRGLEEPLMGRLQQTRRKHGERRGWDFVREDKRITSTSKSDGEALRGLLVKLMEAK